MNFLKNYTVALILTIVVVLTCGIYAGTHAPASNQPGGAESSVVEKPKIAAMPKPDTEDWVCDSANVLRSDTEEEIREWNRAFDSAYYSYVCVATVDSTEGWDTDDFCFTMGEKWNLGSGDMLLVLDIGGGDAYLYEGGDYPDFDYYSYLMDYVAEPFLAGDYDTAVLDLMEGLDGYFSDLGRTADNYQDYRGNNIYWYDAESVYDDSSSETDGVGALIVFIFVLVIILLIARSIDKRRYRSWYNTYGGYTHPTTVFRPIFFWNTFHHRPRYQVRPRYQPGPRPPAGGYGHGSTGGGRSTRPMNGTRPIGGYSSTSRPSSGPRGGGMNSSRSGSAHSGSFGGHGGGFNGGRGSGHSANHSSRGGGFSSSSRSSFGGSSRSGSSSRSSFGGGGRSSGGRGRH